MDVWTVYILNCNDEVVYTGCTDDFDDRIKRHKNGQVRFTRSRLPVAVAVTITFFDKYKAFAFEKYLKSGSGRAFAKRHFF